MNGPVHSSRAQQIENECKLLAALCQATLSVEARTTVLQRLKNHHFAEPDHEVIYRALAAMAPAGTADTLQALTQAVVRMGFPDMELGVLFSAPSPTPDELDFLLAHLQV